MGEGQREEGLGHGGCSEPEVELENRGEDFMEGREQKGKHQSPSV